LAFKQIHHQSFLRERDWNFLKHDSENIFLENIYKLRSYLVDVLKQHLTNPQSFSIASSLLLGARDNLDFHLIKAYSSAGAMHVLAVSGLHVGILYIIIERLLFFMNRNRRLALTKAILIIVITWLYAMLTGFSPSVQRAAIMFTFITIGKQSERGYNIYNVLSASALFQLLLNPFAIMEVGFQLSYLAVAGIVMFQKFFYDLWYIKNKVLDYLWQITCVSIAAQIITFPVGLLYFYQFPSYFFVSNLFVIPASFVIMMTGTALLALHQIQGCAWAIGKLLNWLIWFMNKSVFIIEQLPYSLIQGLSISILESWIIYTIILLFFAFINLKNPKIIIAQLTLITILVGYNTAENIFQHTQKSIVVYATPKTYAYDFIKGKENLLIADEALYKNYSQMQFHIMHNWWKNDIREHHQVAFNNTAESIPNQYLFQHKNYLYFCGKRIVILDKKLPYNIPDRILSVDYIILTKNAKVYLNKIKHYYSFNTIIADGNNAAYRIKQWKKDAETASIKFRAVTNDGAFVSKF
jgi:competence protein ComEC